MALSNEDILSWFSLGKVEVQSQPPAMPITSFTRAVLAKQEREQQMKEIEGTSEDVSEPHNDYQDEDSSDEDIDHADQIRGIIQNDGTNPAPFPTHTSVFDPYDFDVDLNPKNLTISQSKEEIIRMIESSSVTVIEGATGSGKSTQVPQYILESYARERRYCNIICTQPRRIATTSVAKFVADKRKWRLGSLVGYQIAMDKLISEDTRLTFVTTGVLLQKLIKMQNMNQFTHVILDEVHERDKDTDFCLLLVRTFLRTNSRNVKVVLMSATLESQRFAEYFTSVLKLPDKTKIRAPAQIISVSARTFTVDVSHLEKIKELPGFHEFDFPSEDDPRIDPNTYRLACKLISYFDEYEARERARYGRGTVLVFLPGMPEIQLMHVSINKSNINRLTIIPLHSSMSNTEQQKVFLQPESGLRKVILATNIAESSITVPDIKYVIDFCRVKELSLDRTTNYQSLKLQWASQASLEQRTGRAGRVSDGKCYRLVRSAFVHTLNKFSDPEIKRVPLESLVLYAKQMNIGTPVEVLKRAPERPDLEGIAKAVINLKEVGALTLTIGGRADPRDGELTQFGEILASLPVDVKIGKLLILGHVFGLLEDCLIIAAGLSLKPLFESPYYDEGMMSYKSKMSWAEYSFSDCVAILNAYKEWLRRKNTGEFRNSARLEKEWCERNFIKKNVIREVSELVSELASRLASFKITSTTHINKSQPNDDKNLLLLKLVIAGAFYPNYFRWAVLDEEQAIRDMSGHNPLTTVMISGLPANPTTYRSDLAYLFKDCGEGKSIHFDSTRAYLEFQRPHKSHGRDYANGVIDAVYIALKKRLGKRLLSLEAEVGPNVPKTQNSTGTNIQYCDIKPPRTPKQGTHAIIITAVDTPGHFWAQYLNEESRVELQELRSNVRTSTLCPMLNKILAEEMQGRYCLALYSADNTYYRGYIKAVTGEKAEVLFVDYGNQERVPLDFICILPPSLSDPPMQAFECYLAGVRPPIGSKGQSRWTKDDKIKFMDKTLDKQLYLQVYSEVNDTLRVILTDTNEEEDLNINEWLIAEGIAMSQEETSQSKQAHKVLQSYQRPQKPCDLDYAVTLPWVPPVHPHRRHGKPHLLKGPYNPYEVSFQSMTRSGGVRTAKIEPESVNSVVVDSEPQDKHEKMMVASQIHISSSGNVLLARNTTLLPNIHGLAHVMCMIFAPSMELRTDKLKRQYTGALCGLGFCPETGMSLYPDHDIELVFDCLITQKDIADINAVRHAINLIMSSESEWAKPAMKAIQAKARECLMNVIIRSRQDVVQVPSVNFNWNTVPPEDVIVPKLTSYGKDGLPPLLPLHNARAITNEIIKPNRPAERVILLRKVEALEKKTLRSPSNTAHVLFCDLCCIHVNSHIKMVTHLESQEHKSLKRLLIEELADKPDPVTTDTTLD